MTIETMCEAANLHLRRSIGTSAGKHKAELRKMAAAMRVENRWNGATAATPSGEPLPVAADRRSGWPFHVEHHPV
jgi:hypothetical protein